MMLTIADKVKEEEEVVVEAMDRVLVKDMEWMTCK